MKASLTGHLQNTDVTLSGQHGKPLPPPAERRSTNLPSLPDKAFSAFKDPSPGEWACDPVWDRNPSSRNAGRVDLNGH